MSGVVATSPSSSSETRPLVHRVRQPPSAPGSMTKAELPSVYRCWSRRSRPAAWPLPKNGVMVSDSRPSATSPTSQCCRRGRGKFGPDNGALVQGDRRKGQKNGFALQSAAIQIAQSHSRSTAVVVRGARPVTVTSMTTAAGTRSGTSQLGAVSSRRA